MRDYYPMYPVEAEFLAEDEEKEENRTESPKDETFAYLQKIAKTPLLDPEQETALFEKYQEGFRTFTNLLNQFPDWMLASLEIPENNTSNSDHPQTCLLYTSPSPRDRTRSRMPSSA